MIKEQPVLSGSEQKIREYVDRIRSGESKSSIMQGLPPSFVSGIESGLASEEKSLASKEISMPFLAGESSETDSRAKEKQAIKAADISKLNEVRNKLGMEAVDSMESDDEKNKSVLDLITSITRGRKQVVLDLYEDLFKHINDAEYRKKLFSGLFQDVYNRYRSAEYPVDPNEEAVWEYALKSHKVDIDNNKNGWMYRGFFSKNGEKTVTRGSFNVNVTPELIDSLDDIIASGRLKANYKFGQPATPASPVERHDSISIYFFEQPSEEILKELSEIVSPYVRGGNLLGDKVADGFFMSEIGSIQSSHIEDFINILKTKDSAFAEAVKSYTYPKPGTSSSLKMSEAQFYAVRDVAKAFGYDVSYNDVSGFEIK